MKKFLIFIVKLLIIGGAFGYLYWKGQLRWDGLRSALSHPGLVALGVLGAFLPIIISFYRLQMLLKALGITCYKFLDVVRIGYIGCFFSAFMPGSMGDVIKTAYIMRDTHENAKSIASALIDRVQGLFGLLLMGGGAMVLAYDEVLRTPSLHKVVVAVFSIIGVTLCGAAIGILAMLKGRKIAFGVWVLLAALGAFGAWRLYVDCGSHFQFICHDSNPSKELSDILLRGRFIVAIAGCVAAAFFSWLIIPSCQPGHHFSQFVSKYLPGGKALMSLTESILLFHNNLAVLFYSLLLSLVTHTCNLFSLYFLALAVELKNTPTIFSVFFAAPITFIVNSLPLPGGGLGVGEMVFENLMALCRTPTGEVIAGGAIAFLTWRIWYILLCLIGGFPCYLAGRKEIAAVRQEISAQSAGREAVEHPSLSAGRENNG